MNCVLTAWRQHEAELAGFLRHRTGNQDVADDLRVAPLGAGIAHAKAPWHRGNTWGGTLMTADARTEHRNKTATG